MKNNDEDNRVIRAVGSALLLFILIAFVSEVRAGPTDDNHIHVEQVGSGDDIDLNITQIGYDNEVRFSFDHASNTFSFEQNGSGNYIGWVSYWGSGLT